MIRELQKADINKVTDIWLDTNVTAHYFIPKQYWQNNFEFVKELLLQATVYVYEQNQEIQGFIALNDEYIEGVFVSNEMQSHGIGKALLNYAKLLFCKWVVIIRLFTMFRAHCIPISHFFWRQNCHFNKF